MIKKITVLVLIFTMCASLFFVSRSNSVFGSSTHTVIIDAGHGLPDGGAVANDGTIESDINLEIALKLAKNLSSAGFKCLLTRSDAESIYSDGETIHAKKVSDIKERIKIANSDKSAFFISIHMNTYTSPDVYGAQVFYKSDSELSKSVATELQRVINLKFQPENEKNTKPIPSNVYLFNNIENDSVLIECGFMTNENDLKKLKDYSFQNELSKAISEVLTYKILGSD